MLLYPFPRIFLRNIDSVIIALDFEFSLLFDQEYYFNLIIYYSSEKFMKCILVTFTPLSSSPTHPRSTLTSLPTQLNTLFYLFLITHRIQLWCLNELLYGAIHWSMINLLGDTSSKKKKIWVFLPQKPSPPLVVNSW